MLYNEVAAVIAVSFARIFYRSAVNNRLPLFEFKDPRAHEALPKMGLALIDESRSVLLVEGQEIPVVGVPPAIRDWLSAADNGRPGGGDVR
jgi:3-isopropylmalate dehydratase small subunit